jgi:hypothetical protein
MGELKISKSELVEAIDGIFQIVSRPQGEGEGTNYAEKEWKALITIHWVHFLKDKKQKNGEIRNTCGSTVHETKLIKHET